MLSDEDRALLEQVRKHGDDDYPGWRDAWHQYVLIAGGLFLVASGLARGGGVGAAGGFMLGVGVMAVLVSVPISRRLWRLQRLVRAADERGAFEDAEA